MGYTHYWTQPRDYGRETWKQIAEDLSAIIKNAQHVQGIALADGMGDAGTSPIISGDKVSFNGVGKDSHETFTIWRKRPAQEDWEIANNIRRGSDFTKTAQKPYDLAVAACLAYLASLAKPWRVSSDGNGTDWLEAVALARRAVPRMANQIDIPMPIMKGDRWNWREQPVKGSLHADYIDVRACLDGHAYVYDTRDENRCYRFDTPAEAAAYFSTFKERAITVRGSREGGKLFDAWGSFDPNRIARLKRDQTRVLRALLECAADEGRNIPPPAYARPNEMPGIPREQATLADLYSLCE